jgi:hypothetical protein
MGAPWANSGSRSLTLASYRLLEPAGRNADESMEEFGQRVAVNLQELMN